MVERLSQTAKALYQSHGFGPLIPATLPGTDRILERRCRDALIPGCEKAEVALLILATLQEAITTAFAELTRKLPSSSLASVDDRGHLSHPNNVGKALMVPCLRNMLAQPKHDHAAPPHG